MANSKLVGSYGARYRVKGKGSPTGIAGGLSKGGGRLPNGRVHISAKDKATFAADPSKGAKQ